jgi:arylsulfatase A-like enzyme
MCSPTRAGFLTGRYPMRYGMGRSVVRPWATFGLPPAERTLAEALGEAGYRHRGAFGKWHLGHLEPQWHPLAQGFTTYKGLYNGAGHYFTRDRDGETDWHKDAEPVDEEGYTTNLIADAAVEFIGRSAKEAPFFCYVPFSAPHDPLQAPEEYIQRYADLDDAPNDGKPSEKQRLAAMIACMDDGIGRILGAVEKAGVANDTIVLFFSDNGGIGGIPGNNVPLRAAKLTVYEGGVRVPAVVWWPGVIEGGRKIDAPIVNVDLFPTLLALAGVPVNASPDRPLDGVDVSGVLTGRQPKAPKRDLYFFNGQTGLETEQNAVTAPDGWKLIVLGPDVRRPGGYRTPAHKVELYNVLEDPSEKTNRAAEKPELVEKLGAKIVAFRKSEPEKSLPPINRKPRNFQPPAKWRNAPPAAAAR